MTQLWLLGPALLLAALPPATPAKAVAPPNVILIVTDDQDARSLEVMPNVRSLIGAKGLTFANAFVSESLCSPSRASLLTGRYAHNHGVEANDVPLGGFPRFEAGGLEATNLATWLRAGGYHTALVGKYLNGYPGSADPAHVPPGWDEWQAVFSERGSDNYFDYSVNENGSIVRYASKPEDYSTDVIGARVVSLLRRASFTERPFFILVTPSAPHSSATAAPRHEELFVGLPMPRSPSFDEADVSDKPAYVKAEPRIREAELEQLERRYRRRLRTLVAVDEMLQHVVAALEASGQLDRTWIFFTSDNGWFDGEHRFVRGKAAPYEESVRVPLLVRGPGVPAGEVREHLVANVDLAPTIAAVAGVTPSLDNVDGRSLLPLLSARPLPLASWRHDLLLEYWSLDPAEGVPGFAGLRSQNGLYVEYATGERELYNLTRDPDELENAYAKADRAERKQWAERLARLKGCRGADCRKD